MLQHDKLLTTALVLILLAGGGIGWFLVGKKPAEKPPKPEPVSAPSRVKLDTLDITTDDPDTMAAVHDDPIVMQNKSLDYDGFAAQNTALNSMEQSIATSKLIDESTIGSISDTGMMSFDGNLGSGGNEVSRLELNRKLGNTLASKDSQDIQALAKLEKNVHDYANWLPKSNDHQSNGLSLESARLVSFERFGLPRVYNSDQLPTFKQLAEVSVATRAASISEIRAIRRLKRGESIVVDDSQTPPLVLSAIRATEQCVKCHRTSPGDLLGAFTNAATSD